MIVFLFSTVQFAAAQSEPHARKSDISQNAWNPKRTWIFFVGLLEWKDSKTFASFPQENRRDAVLLNLLRESGVPENQIVYLKDGAATTAKIQAEFAKLLSKAQPEDWVFVYYCGHGYKTGEMETFLASYDVGEKIQGWSIDSIPDAIEAYFKGSKAIIALDNCYSGAMANAVKDGKRRVSYAVLASSEANSMSTGNWTFTEAIISAFQGENFIDDDQNGSVTFAELAANAEEDMLFAEEQVSSYAFTGDFDPQTIIAKAEPNLPSRVGERIEVFSAGEWWKALITDADANSFKVHYYGYETINDEWIKAKQIRQFKPKQFKIGERVRVESDNEWYPARVLEVRGGSHHIKYDDYDDEWNEWVSSDRIKKIK
ncbi:MAG: agenet domain-containing protein [Pyrinomonadaceae bacterium]